MLSGQARVQEAIHRGVPLQRATIELPAISKFTVCIERGVYATTIEGHGR